MNDCVFTRADGTCATHGGGAGPCLVRIGEVLVPLNQALEKSVQLQSHYAQLLNDYDGGHRIVFKDAKDWMARLAMTDKERVADAERRAAEGKP
jgi:hypothetical protein